MLRPPAFNIKFLRFLSFDIRIDKLKLDSQIPRSLSDKGERFVVPSAQPSTERESWQSRANRSIRVSKINRYLRLKSVQIYEMIF